MSSLKGLKKKNYHVICQFFISVTSKQICCEGYRDIKGAVSNIFLTSARLRLFAVYTRDTYLNFAGLSLNSCT